MLTWFKIIRKVVYKFKLKLNSTESLDWCLLGNEFLYVKVEKSFWKKEIWSVIFKIEQEC